MGSILRKDCYLLSFFTIFALQYYEQIALRDAKTV
jgi:hypothetical protein